MISLQRSMHSSQMYTPGPAMSFLTCFWLLPQNEHLSRSPPSPMRATVCFPFAWETPRSSDSWCCLMSDGTLPGPPFGPPLARFTSTWTVPRGGGRYRSGSADVGVVHLPGGDDLVDQAVRQGVLGREDLVALDVLADLVDRRRRVLGQHVFELT